KSATEIARFSYDALGRRVDKSVSGVTSMYVYDGYAILREISGAATLRYVHGPSIDESLAHEDGTATITYLHADVLGNVVQTTGPSGTPLMTRRYDAFGNLQLGLVNGYAFTGREWDSESGLYYYRARYYDPQVGRFTSEDALGLRSGMNLFSYVGSNP